jgi:hypothetical protein
MKGMLNRGKRLGRRRRWGSVQGIVKGMGRWAGRYGRVAVLVLTCWSIQGLVYVATIDSAKATRRVEEPKAFGRGILEGFRHANSATWVDGELHFDAPILNGEKTFCNASDFMAAAKEMNWPEENDELASRAK